MWPILIVSIITVTVIIERLFFITRESLLRQPQMADQIIQAVAEKELDKATSLGEKSKDFVAVVLCYGLKNRKPSLSDALLRAANRELARFNRGLSILDTAVTLGPLLGLLGTVTGMIRAFGMLGNTELGTPVAITGGIAEALIATAFGLGVAIIALIPYNLLCARLETARLKIQDAASQVEFLLDPNNTEER